MKEILMGNLTSVETAKLSKANLLLESSARFRLFYKQ